MHLKKNKTQQIKTNKPKRAARTKKKAVQPERITNKRINQPHLPWRKRNTSQDSIPFDYMYEDGIAALGNHRYSVTYNFDDINYVNTDESTRVGIFEAYCYFINAYDDTVQIQIHVVNQPLSRTTTKLYLSVPETASERLSHCIGEYNNMINKRITGSKSYVKKKYVTLTIIENSYDEAAKRFDRIENETLSLLRQMGCGTHQLNRNQRLTLLREYYRPDDLSEISTQASVRTGICGKDLIAPYGMDMSNERYLKLDDSYIQCLFFSDFPQDLSDDIMRDITNVDRDMFITINILPQDPTYAIKETEKRLKRMDTEKYNVFARQSKAGVLVPEAPRELTHMIENTESFLKALRTRNEKMFLANILVMVRGKSQQEVDLAVDEVTAPAKKNGCTVKPFSFDHENALNSIVPLGRNDTFVKRTFTTTSLSAFIPFNVVEIVQPTGFSYGKNSLSNNVLMLDRKLLTNPHGFYFGTSGSGKSMGAKAEVFECFNRTNDDMIIIDPDGEFSKMVDLLGGQVIKVSNGSSTYFNPFEINEYYGGEEESDPIPFKSDFIISLLEVTLNYRHGIDPITRSVIDHCVRDIYKPYQKHPGKKNIPTFKDFYQDLGQQPSEEARMLKSALEIYVEGSLNIFAEHTNVNINNRLICFDTKDLGKQLKTMGMTIIQDWVWNHISANQAKNKTTWLWNDEIHHSLRNPSTAAWLINSWKRGRKYGLIATGMTQEVRDVCMNEEAKTLIANSEFIMLYKQKPDMIEDLAQVMDLSDRQTKKLLTCPKGTGLFKAGNSMVEFNNIYPDDTELFQVMMTDINRKAASPSERKEA